MEIINLYNLLLIIFVFILLERLFEILRIKRAKSVKTYNRFTTYFLVLAYLSLNTIVIIELLQKRENNVFFSLIGLIVYFVSISYRREAIRTLGIYFRPDISFVKDHSLCTSGIYSWVRHPYYFGAILEVVSIPVIFNSMLGLVFCLAINVPLLCYRVFIEEKALVDYFGDRYLNYASSVPMLLSQGILSRKKNTVFEIFSLTKTIGIKNLIELVLSKKQNSNHVRGFFVSSCIGTLLKIAFFEQILKNGEVVIDDFCKEHDYDLYSLKAICDYLVSVSLFESSGSKYKIDHSFHITSSIGAYQFINAYLPVFANLEGLLRKEKRYGEEIKRDIRYVTIASAETEKIIPYPYARKLIKKWKCNSILDLGCGNAAFLIYVSDSLSKKSYGVDISETAIKEANGNIKRHNLSKRLSVFQSDIRTLDKLESNPDVLTALYIFHEFIDDEKDLGKLSDILLYLKRNFPTSKLIVLESCKYGPSVLQENKSLIAEHHLFHRLSKQNLLSFQDWKNLFVASDYKILEAIELKIAGQGFFVLE